MAIVYRSSKGSRLTVAEIDGNFQDLADAINTKVDSNNVRTIIDSDYVQDRLDPPSFTFDLIYQLPLSSQLDSGEFGSLGLQAGMMTTADGVSWDPASKGTGRPYPVFWDGVDWLAMT